LDSEQISFPNTKVGKSLLNSSVEMVPYDEQSIQVTLLLLVFIYSIHAYVRMYFHSFKYTYIHTYIHIPTSTLLELHSLKYTYIHTYHPPTSNQTSSSMDPLSTKYLYMHVHIPPFSPLILAHLSIHSYNA
jgi:hypothetical protein